MGFLRPATRALVVVGWVVIAAGQTVDSVHQLTASGVSNLPWEFTFHYALVPLTYLAVAVGWWFLGGATIDSPRGARVVSVAFLAFGLQALIQLAVSAADYHLSAALAGATFRVSEGLLLVGSLLVTIGLAFGAAQLRAAVLDLPGVVGDVVPDLAQGEPEGPAPVA